ncbi:hypothetical protein LPJ73_001632 [Coemansia sp. RSA 2703]|nr:hypothetical protein LPJ73_001632 [Coemansia sp. RSA 2703]KAJ2372505.1 hypothetical protein IW150_004087 [Coemansia sp. RSA 2607]KAJ2394452.1 hypothetical protein GGI05_002032 [Coemansia sp. RSA 2603]
MSTKAISTLPTYTGRNDVLSLSEWIEKAKDAFLEDNIVDENRKLACLRRRVEGQARVEVDLHKQQSNMSAEQKAELKWSQVTTVKEFEKYFKSKFAALEVDDDIRKRLRELKQTGTVSEYVTAETRIMGGYKMSDEERRFDFLHGLKPEVQEYVRSQEPKTFSEMQTAALKYERIKGGYTVTQVDVTPPATQGFTPEPMDVDAINISHPSTSGAAIPVQRTTNPSGATENLFTMSQVCELVEIAALLMNRGAPYQPAAGRPGRNPRYQERMLTMNVNGAIVTASNQQAWVRQLIRDNNLCFRCGSADHLACQCNQGKEPGQQ